MARAWCVRVLSLLSLAALVGCSKNVEGELTAAACSNNLDDDGDGPRDCDDPDCWVFCPPRNALRYGDASSQLDSDVSSNAAPRQNLDAGKRGTLADDDAGMSKPDP